MSQCWNCRANLPDGAKFCGKCGKRQEGMPDNPSVHVADATVIMPGLVRSIGAQPSSVPSSPPTSKEAIEAQVASTASPTGQITSSPTVQGNTTNHAEQVTLAVKRFWKLLDKALEKKNQKSFDDACQDLTNPQAWQQLAKLGEIICRNAVFRYVHNSSLAGGNLTEKQLEDVILLASFSARYGTDDVIAKAKYYSLLFNGLKGMRAHTLDPESFVSELKTKFAEQGEAKAAGFSWSDVLGIATHLLSERRRTNSIDLVETKAWIGIFASLASMLNLEELKLFVAEIQQHSVPDSIALRTLLEKLKEGEKPPVLPDNHPLGFLGTERRRELLECIRDSRMDRLNEILHENRLKLFAELSRVLSDQMFDEILPPRRSVHIRGKNIHAPDRFQEAKRLIMSSNGDEQKVGLELFEQARTNAGHEHTQLAREWWLFALTRTMGILRASPEWEVDRAKGVASWEEIWNLAIFYMRTGRTAQALEIIRPGVEKTIAPFSHLRFALYCSVQILQQEKRFAKEVRDSVVNFLINYLEKLPLPVCYLVWSLLVNEYPDNAPLRAKDFIEQARILGIFQDVLDRPVDILKPEDRLEDASVDAFEKHLHRLGLEDTWRLWINDYAERNRYNFGIWQALSDAYDRAGDTERAEKALLHIVDMQFDQYKKQRESGGTANLERLKASLRSNLYRLFDFYRRKARLQDSDVEAKFKRYYKTLPELWDGRESANNQLIKLTRQLIDKVGQPTLPPPTESTKAWYTLAVELQSVQDVSGIRSLQTRLVAAIELLAGEQKLAKERAAVVVKVLNRICTLDITERNSEGLLHEVDRLSKAIQEAATLIEQEAALKPLRALIEVLRRVFKNFSQEQRLSPKLHVDPVPLGGGIPNDITETALVLRVANPGPGEVTNLLVACTDKGIIASNREGTIDSLAQGQTAVVAIPVTVRPPESARPLDCQINLTYQWGILKDLQSSQSMNIGLFSFHDFLQEHAIHDYDFPNPYVFDGPIDFTKDDPRLFQGREAELSLVHTVYFKGQMRGVPLYFHGIRKVGKTSLLNRIALLLREGAFAPFVVELKGIKASQQSLEVLVNSFTRRIYDVVQNNGLNMEGIEPVPVTHDNPIIGVEQFFNALRKRTGNIQPVLLLDEFYVMVAEQTTILLDLLHRIHQSGLISFIMSGWYRPETLRRACSETQLFPLMGRPIDFLPLSAVKQVLSEPIASFGIEVPDATMEHLFLQTAGNPYHVAKVAYNGIARLNAEHRTVLAPQDIDEVANHLAGDQANFMSSSFSPLILSAEEQDVAIRFARELGSKRDSLPVDEVTRMFSPDVVQRLEEKYLFEYLSDAQGGCLRIRGKMLATFLRSRMTEPVAPPPSPSNKKRVGIFVDYENFLPLIPQGMKAKEVGEILVKYAERYGDVVCKWACADPRNVHGWQSIELGLRGAGFLTRSPSDEPDTGRATKNLTDLVLLECIYDESTHTVPDIYILVSGDKDYYERVKSLIKNEYTVRLSASMRSGHLAEKYHKLEEERKQYQIVAGKSERDFFIDNLDEILRMKPSAAS